MADCESHLPAQVVARQYFARIAVLGPEMNYSELIYTHKGIRNYTAMALSEIHLEAHQACVRITGQLSNRI